jgi:RNA polymerase sigma-70 factor (ECF subfamily)
MKTRGLEWVSYMAIEDFVRQLQEGNRSAFRPVVEACQAEIRTLIACHGVSPPDVDDIAQATFLHVYQHIGEYQTETNFRAWTRAIAVFKTRAFWEEKRRELRNKNQLLQYYLLERVPRPPAEGHEDRAKRLARCLDRLEQRARTLLQKRYEGVPVTTMARELGRTVPAVKMMLLRIRSQLRDCVEAHS